MIWSPKGYLGHWVEFVTITGTLVEVEVGDVVEVEGVTDEDLMDGDEDRKLVVVTTRGFVDVNVLIGDEDFTDVTGLVEVEILVVEIDLDVLDVVYGTVLLNKLMRCKLPQT
jgi:hypothetical protein